ncbi:hypothetical protein [Streptomyces sp. CB01881]|uniref:hypothetical protein n=1 Tax=Streptomyces sp. CB01881 TaxID=2078691 RepID=UPI001883994F|nr:hypothetical protein [Streptomyces sp. CB01881]
MDNGNHDGLGGYWDPLPTARRLLIEYPNLDQFGGLWQERNWRNVPGPFYGADTDSMQMGRHDAPFHIAYDDDHGPLDGREFVFRQPVGPVQTYDLLSGCFFGHGGFAMDGDDHWTAPAVREWWQERGQVREWAFGVSSRWSRTRGKYREHYRDAAQGLRDYTAYLDHGLEEYLRGYLFWLAERRPRRAGESLPRLERPRSGATGQPSAAAPGGRTPLPTARVPAPNAAKPLLAGYFVAIPELITGPGAIPGAARLITASDCLIDRLPQDGCWFDTAQEALAACTSLQGLEDARLYALLVPADHAARFVADIHAAATYEPVLLTHLDSQVGEKDGHGDRTPVPKVAEGGREIGWEVLGYDCGLLHTWLCNDLHQDAVLTFGVTTDARGLLPSRDAAERVAAWANTLGDIKPVTWFPAALIEWDTPIESRFVPITTEAPQPPPQQSWWQRLIRQAQPDSRGGA